MIKVTVEFFGQSRDEYSVEEKVFGNRLSTVDYLSTLSNVEPSNVLPTTEGVRLTWNDLNLEAYVHGATIDQMLEAYDRGECWKCEGDGWIECYSHVRSGVCFECWGSGLNREGGRHRA